jgi:predicted transposase/invertase (TIGR01784 family)
MKDIFYEQKLRQNHEKILALAHEILEKKGETFYSSTLVYFLKAANLEADRLIEASQKLSEKGGKIAMTTAEKLEEKGRKEGIQKNQHQTAIKMIEKGADDEFIKECTGLSQETIDKLRKNNS